MKKLNEDIDRIKKLMKIHEDEDDLKDFFRQEYTGQMGSHDEDQMAPDGMDDDSDLGEEEVFEGEISEEGEDAGAAASSGGGGGYPTVTKWDSGAARGKGNPIDSKKKWESGAARGKGNPIDFKKKWESGTTRGKGNTLM